MDTSRANFKILLIGEAPSRTSDPKTPFSGRSGDRLRSLADLDRFELRNLLDEYPGAGTKGTLWDATGARVRAREVATGLDGRAVVFVGRRVATAFGHRTIPWCEWRPDVRGFDVAAIPHPSGIVRFWNDAANVDAVRSFLETTLAPLDRFANENVEAAPGRRLDLDEDRRHHLDREQLDRGEVGGVERNDEAVHPTNRRRLLVG